MLQKSNSKKVVKLRYLLLLPVLGAMLVYTSCAQEPQTNSTETQSNYVQSSDSEIMARIAALNEAIAAKGEMSAEEAKALKMLMASASGNSEQGSGNLHFNDKTSFGGMDFGMIDKVPIYPGCEGLENKAAQKCFTEKVASFIVSNFDTKQFSGSSIQGRQRIAVQFVIGSDGAIKDVVAKAAFEPLQVEAARVVRLLPRMTPGEHDGKKVNVQFAVPILFELD